MSAKMPTFKHLQYCRDDLQTLAKRLNALTDRVSQLEALSISASKSQKK